MIKQPILGPMLNTSSSSSEANQTAQANGQSLPKGANGFAKLFVSEASALKSADGSKKLGSEIRLSSDVLSKVTVQDVKGQDKASELEAVLQQINQKIADAGATVEAFDTQPTPPNTPMVLADGQETERLVSAATLLTDPQTHQTHQTHQANDLLKPLTVNQHQDIDEAVAVDQLSAKFAEQSSDQDDEVSPVLTESIPLQVNQTVVSSNVPKESNLKHQKANPNAEDSLTTIATSTANEEVVKELNLKNIDGKLVVGDTPTQLGVANSGTEEVTKPQISLEGGEKPLVGTDAHTATKPTNEINSTNQNSNVDVQQVAQQSIQPGVNDKQLDSVQQGHVAQASVAGQAQHSAVQQPQGASSTTVQSQPGSTQQMATNSQQPAFDQGAGQQGQQGQQGNSGQSQQQMQQAQAFAQLQKQDVARVQQEGVRAFNDAIATEDAKAEKSEKLLGSLGMSFEGRNQLPPGMQTMSQPMRSPQWGQALGQRITYMANNKVQEAKITLNPEKLGSIQIKLNIDKDNQLHVSMTAQQGTTREAIENAMPRLREILDAAGIGLGSLDVRDERAFAEDQNQDASKGGDGSTVNGNAMDSGEEDLAESTPVEITTDNLVDYYA